MDIVDEIEANGDTKAVKIQRLWAVAQLNDHQPLGDKAWLAMQQLTDPEITMAIAFLGGFAQGYGRLEIAKRRERLEELACIKKG